MLSYQVVQQMAGAERLPLSEHRLKEQGLLASVAAGRQMVQVRRTLEGRPRQVLHLKAGDLAEGIAQAPPTSSLQQTAGRHGS
jgi:hypothetical protein